MNIHELVTEKHILESDLRELIHNRVKTFTELTGVAPNDISVNMTRFDAIGKGVECRVSGVEVGIRL